MIDSAGIYFRHLPDEEFDRPFGESTGAATIFGATGGVMEAALRTAVERLTGKELESVDFTEVRGMNGIKEAEYDVNGKKIKVAVASGTKNAKILMDKVRSGEAARAAASTEAASRFSTPLSETLLTSRQEEPRLSIKRTQTTRRGSLTKTSR